MSFKASCWWCLICCLIWKSIKRLNLHNENSFLIIYTLELCLTAKVQVLMKNKIVKEMFWALKQMGLNSLLCKRIINGEENEKWRNRLKSKGKQHESLGSLKAGLVIQHCSSVRGKKKKVNYGQRTCQVSGFCYFGWWVGFFRRRKENIWHKCSGWSATIISVGAVGNYYKICKHSDGLDFGSGNVFGKRREIKSDEKVEGKQRFQKRI